MIALHCQGGIVPRGLNEAWGTLYELPHSSPIAVCRPAPGEQWRFATPPAHHWLILRPQLSNFTHASTSSARFPKSGTFVALRAVVIVAIPSWQQRVSPVLDTATRLLVVTCRDGREASRHEVLLGPLPPEEFARSVVELRVNLLLCGALSLDLRHALEEQGVRVWPHLCGAVNEVLQAFGCGRLNRPKFRMPGCRRQHARPNCCQRYRAVHLVKTSFKPTKTEL